ncbi:MAG: hypothetical protein J6Q22_01090, partial [Prevotella sp.]|nr:hypothetical protein [Prevotella sp.]
MRKHFLLVFLLAILPLAGWATKPVGTAPTAATSLVYNGSAQALLSAPAQFPAGYETGSGQILYIALEGTGTPLKSNSGWSTEIPTATDAKTYHVWYYITNDGTSNFNEDGDIKQVGTGVTIGKKPIAASDFTLPKAISGLVFTNADQDIFEPATWTGETLGKFQYRLRQGSLSNPSSLGGWSSVGDAIPQGFNAVSYQVEVSVTDVDPNYQWTLTNQRASNSMARATWVEGENYTAPTQKADAIFNNTNQNYLTAGTNTLGATMQYATTTGYWATWRPTVDHNDFRTTNVQQNPITRYYRIQGGNGYNWNSLNATAIQANILPADAPAATGGTLATSPLEYTGANQQLVLTGYTASILGSGTATVRYYVNGTQIGTNIANVTGKEFGDYEISYDYVYSGNAVRNYKQVEEPKPVLGTVTIDKKLLTIAGVGFTKDYDEIALEATPENAVLFVDGIGWLAADDNDAKKAEILAKLLTVKSGLPQVNVGSYSVEIESKEDPSVSYKIEPLFHKTVDLNITKVANTWVNDVTIASTWAYGSTPDVPSCDPAFKTKETGDPAEITYKYYTDAACTTEFTDPIDETMPVGTYYVKAFVEGCNNFFELESVTPASFEITATDPAWTKAVAIEGWEYTKYDATANAPTAEVDDDAEITYKYFSDAGCTTEITTDPATWTIGTYWVKAYAAATANHNAVENGPAEFKVTPTTLPELALTFTAVDYTGENQQPTVAEVQALITEVEATEYDVTFTDADDNVVADFTDAGTYYVVITGAANYAKLDAEGNINFQKKEFVINKVDPVITAPIANKLTYTAEKQILASEAFSADGTFEYSLTGEDGSYTADVPTGINAADYMVYTKFTPDGNHNEATVEPVPVTILPAQLKITLTNTLEKDWDGLPFGADQVEETYVIDGLLGNDVYDIPFTLALPVTEENNFIDAKVYELKKLELTWKDEEVKNYKYAFMTVGSVTINKADIQAEDYEAPYAKDELVFNGEEQEIVTAGEMINEYGTILFAQGETAPAEDSADWTEDVPAQINAGEYPVWYMIKGDDNHNNVAAAQLTGKIAPKPWTAVLAFEDLEDIYNGKDFMPADLSIKDGEVALVEGEDKDYTLTIKNGEEEVTEIINAGTYVFTYTGVGNYEGSET